MNVGLGQTDSQEHALIQHFKQHTDLTRLSEMTFICGRSAQPLANRVIKAFHERIDKHFKKSTPNSRAIMEELKRERLQLTLCKLKEHNNGETFAQIRGNVHNKDVYFIQTFPQPNQDLMETFVMCDALARGGTRSITMIIPFIPYQRQDKKDDGRVPIAAKMVFNLLKAAAGTVLKRIITFDLHANQEQGHWDGPFDNLSAVPLFAAWYKTNLPEFQKSEKSAIPLKEQIRVVSPDAGGAPRARFLAKLLKTQYEVMTKVRTGHGKIDKKTIAKLEWDCQGKKVIIVDDMIDTGGTIARAATYLREEKGAKVYLCATHPIFSDKKKEDENAQTVAEKLRASGAHVLTTDSLPEKYSGTYSENGPITCFSLAYDIAFACFARQVGISLSGFLKKREKTLEKTATKLRQVYDHTSASVRVELPELDISENRWEILEE